MIGREIAAESAYSPTRDETRWIGKPWRRVELLTRRHFYRGVQTEVERYLSIHVGSRRLGLALTLILIRQPVLDYTEERQ